MSSSKVQSVLENNVLRPVTHAKVEPIKLIPDKDAFMATWQQATDTENIASPEGSSRNPRAQMLDAFGENKLQEQMRANQIVNNLLNNKKANMCMLNPVLRSREYAAGTARTAPQMREVCRLVDVLHDSRQSQTADPSSNCTPASNVTFPIHDEGFQ
jgi:hypothetical protein